MTLGMTSSTLEKILIGGQTIVHDLSFLHKKIFSYIERFFNQPLDKKHPLHSLKVKLQAPLRQALYILVHVEPFEDLAML